MDVRHKKLLRKHRLELSNQLVVGGTIIQYLYQEGTLTESHVEEIRTQDTNKKKTIKMLDILPTRGPRAFGTFLESLKEEFPWIREKLQEEAQNEDSQPGAAEKQKISEQVLSTVPTEKQLNKLSVRLGPEWETILIELGLTTNDIYRCKANHSCNVQSQTMAAFVMWKQRFGKRATVQCLLSSLEAAEIDPSVMDDIFQ
ncbi:death domain-containing protein CRADD [Huso huso]|uniref:Death domain-containing protein CRADD n=2 Tax=Acipenseridae TaxID=7900 RepID=A0A444TZK9_ACIRT|nr:Death domain-containing protein CRADD [Acipenser ruthenus]